MTIIKAKSTKHLNAMLLKTDGVKYVYSTNELDSLCDSKNIFVLHCGVLFDTFCSSEIDLLERMAIHGYKDC